MESHIRSLVQNIHDSSSMAVVVVAGAGSHAVDWLLGVGGASRTILEATVPYSAPSFAEYLGCEPEQSVNAETARGLARSAYRRAVHLREHDDIPVIGLACTATIATDRPKRGEHRSYVAAWTDTGVTTYGLQFLKGLRDRSGEETATSKLLLRALCEASNIGFGLDVGLDGREEIDVQNTGYEDEIESLVAAHVSSVVVRKDGTVQSDGKGLKVILSGSFNPLHEGHEKLVGVASKIAGEDVAFELSITNVDKPALEESEIRKRIAQFAGKYDVAVTRALVFYEKARLFPGSTFVIGWDTAVRLVDPKYYDNSQVKMLMALGDIRKFGCRFLVAGRVNGGIFKSLDSVPVPSEFKDMFFDIPESSFRSDISSTELRRSGQTL